MCIIPAPNAASWDMGQSMPSTASSRAAVGRITQQVDMMPESASPCSSGTKVGSSGSRITLAASAGNRAHSVLASCQKQVCSNEPQLSEACGPSDIGMDTCEGRPPVCVGGEVGG